MKIEKMREKLNAKRDQLNNDYYNGRHYEMESAESYYSKDEELQKLKKQYLDAWNKQKSDSRINLTKTN